MTFTSLDTHTTRRSPNLEHRFGRVELIENETSRSRGPSTPISFVHKTLTGPSAVRCSRSSRGITRSGANEVAVTSGIASAFHLSVGDSWRVGAVTDRWSASSRTPRASSTSSPSSRRDSCDTPSRSRSCSTRRACRCAPSATTWRPRRRSRSRTRSTRRRSRLPRSCSACCSSPSSPSAASPSSRSAGCARSACSRRQARPTATCVSSCGERCRRRSRRRGCGVRVGPRHLARISPEPRAERAPRHRCPGPAVGRRRRSDGARRCRGVLCGLTTGAGGYKDPDRPRALGPTCASSSDPPLGAPRHRPPRCRLPPPRLLGC